MQHFIAGHKTYENAAAALSRYTQLWFARGWLLQLDVVQQQLIVGKILQKRPWQALVRVLDFSGQKQARIALRQAVELLFGHD